MANQEEYLSYERLSVWEKSVDFAVDVLDAVESMSTGRRHYRLFEQIEACSTSIAMNIAEGKGRWSLKEYKQFLFYSRSSLYETLTLMVIFKKKNWIANNQYNDLRSKALEINKMLNSLIYAIKTKIDQEKK